MPSAATIPTPKLLYANPIQQSKSYSSTQYPIHGQLSREHYGNLAWLHQHTTLQIIDTYSKSVIATLDFQVL